MIAVSYPPSAGIPTSAVPAGGLGGAGLLVGYPPIAAGAPVGADQLLWEDSAADGILWEDSATDVILWE